MESIVKQIEYIIKNWKFGDIHKYIQILVYSGATEEWLIEQMEQTIPLLQEIESDEERLLSMMDSVVGWCSPMSKISYGDDPRTEEQKRADEEIRMAAEQRRLIRMLPTNQELIQMGQTAECSCLSLDLLNFGCRCKKDPQTYTQSVAKVRTVITDRQLTPGAIRLGFLCRGNGETVKILAKYRNGSHIDYAELKNPSQGVVKNRIELHDIKADGTKYWVHAVLTNHMAGVGTTLGLFFEMVVIV